MPRLLTICCLATVLTGCDSEPEDDANVQPRVQVRIDADGYHPDRVPARVGSAVTLVFTRADEDNCGDELVIASHDIRRDIPVGQPVEVTLTPTEAGEIRFACGMDMYRGAVVVTQ